MRELSEREAAFLRERLPAEHSAGESSTRIQSGGFGARLGSLLGSVLRYLPLAIGTLTLIAASLMLYLYIWGRDFFKVSEVQRMEAEGALGLMDSTSSGWLRDMLAIFDTMPLIILGTVAVGAALMILSMILLRKRTADG